MSKITIDYQAEGDIFDIQRFSLNDGPGIRTIVFLKGCPLSCWWCSNPESQRRRPVVMYNAADCVHCRRCESACQRHAVTFSDDGAGTSITRFVRATATVLQPARRGPWS